MQRFAILLGVLIGVAFCDVAGAYYHAQLGRFVTRDPIGYRGSTLNLYEYADGVPTTKTDPEGLLPAPGDLACGIRIDLLAGSYIHTKGWAPGFAHCWSHCTIAQRCKNGKEVSDAASTFTESQQTAACLALIAKIGRFCACRQGVCQSAIQATDFNDNNTGFGLGAQYPNGDCEAMCKLALGGQFRDDPGMEEGPSTPRPYGPLCR